MCCGIDELGHIAGSRWRCTGGPENAAFLWTPESGIVLTDLPEGTFDSFSYDVNDAGQVVGTFDDAVESHAFLWQNGGSTDLGLAPGASTGQATAINNVGHITVAGYVAGKNGNVLRSFLLVDGQFTDLGVLPGFDYTYAWDINDLDQVVGRCWQADPPFDQTGFIWQDGGITDLNDQVPEPINVNDAAVLVDADNAPACGDGLSWETAYANLPDAVDFAHTSSIITEIWVKAGTYYPDRDCGDPDGTCDPGPCAVESSFVMHPGVTIYGGFAGGETMLAQRDVDANVTTLS